MVNQSDRGTATAGYLEVPVRATAAQGRGALRCAPGTQGSPARPEYRLMRGSYATEWVSVDFAIGRSFLE